jgi:predicted transcriptional regulator
MPKSLVEMCVDIVSAQASHKAMDPDELTESIRTIFHTLQSLQHTNSEIEGIETATPQDNNESAPNATLTYLRRNPMKSIQRHQIICLESGKAYKVLSNRHLALYGLTSREYKKKWGIPLRTPLSARSLSAQRRKVAKERGLGQHLVAWRAKQARHQEQQSEAS